MKTFFSRILIFLWLLIGFTMVRGDNLPSGNNLFRSSSDSVMFYEERYQQGLQSGDTARAIVCLIALGEIHSHLAQYSQSYDCLWHALLLADNYRDTLLLTRVHTGIGWLYSFYERRDEAFRHFNIAIQLAKHLVTQQSAPVNDLISGYYGLATFYRELHDTEGARRYLDSCYLYVNQVPAGSIVGAYLDAELAYNYIQKRDYQEALRLIATLRSRFENHQPTYLVLLDAFEGDAYKGNGDYQKSEDLYMQALAVANQYHSHTNYIPEIYERLADLYFMTGNYRKAYENLNAAKAKSEALFDSRSLNNRPLLEITDAFRKVKEEKQQLVQEQRLKQLEQEDRINVLRNLLLLGALVVVVLIFWGYLRFIKMKHRAKEEFSLKSRELEQKNSLELLELKNRELASSALRLIEKDKMLLDLKKHLSDDQSSQDLAAIKGVIRGITVSNNQNWEEFEARFVEVNDKFYRTLKDKHPDLTPGDLKLCALIKLNFNSKEMAGLLGIGVESVHTIRYRLRRKLGLTRKDNLTEYLFQMDGQE